MKFLYDSNNDYSLSLNENEMRDSESKKEDEITAIGLEANKRELGYSIQNIDAEEIQNANETNLVSALSGKAAGVQVVSSSGTPGASAQIRISERYPAGLFPYLIRLLLKK